MSWYRAPLWPDITSCQSVAIWDLRSCIYWAPSLTRGRVSKSKLLYDWQYVLVSSTLVGLATRYYFLSKCAVWNLRSCIYWAPSLTRGRVSNSKLLYDWRLVSMSWYRAPLWDLRPDITSCRNVAVWNLRCCFCGAPSLTRGRLCNLQCNHSMVRVAQNPQPYFTVSSETPPTWKSKSKSKSRYKWRSVSLYVKVSRSPRLLTRYYFLT
jgi:hypothetical protein